MHQANELNQVIEDLFLQARKIDDLHPLFNFRTLRSKPVRLLEQGKRVEIIVGDKVANDFYIPPEQPFKMAGALPYLYESNLRRFRRNLMLTLKWPFNGAFMERTAITLITLKGVWVDNQYILLTGTT